MEIRYDRILFSVHNIILSSFLPSSAEENYNNRNRYVQAIEIIASLREDNINAAVVQVHEGAQQRGLFTSILNIWKD